MKYIILGLMLSSAALAQKNDLTHRPKSFLTSGGKAVFVDFLEANYKITYDLNSRSALATATIKFDAPEAGLPIFDSEVNPTSVTLNGEVVSSKEIKTPSRETAVRIINKDIAVGTHTAVISVPIKNFIEWKNKEVRNAFWHSDIMDRKFLERYMPANLEYDQVKMKFEVQVVGNTKSKYKVYSNGEVTLDGTNKFTINFPEYFNSSSIFYHIIPEGASDEIQFTLKSVDGRDIPVTVYTIKPVVLEADKLKLLTTQIFHELEGDYGAWPHPSLTIYNAGQGGMEYHGATITSTSALGHEMFHSYFARGVMPANGNAGWLDEALASWRDKGYNTTYDLVGVSRMSNQLYYTRTTDISAYSFGERFMSYMDGKFKEKGGLKPFMRFILEKRLFAPIFVEEFIKDMSEFYGESVEEDFKKFTFGTKNVFQKSLQSGSLDHPMHQKMTDEELQKLL